MFYLPSVGDDLKVPESMLYYWLDAEEETWNMSICTLGIGNSIWEWTNITVMLILPRFPVLSMILTFCS
jgi:hypothetical protein